MMKNNEEPTRPKRQYPPFYEKVIPIALGILVVAIIVILLIILVVALRLIPGST